MKKSLALFLLTLFLLSSCATARTRPTRPAAAAETSATQPPAATKTPKPLPSPTPEPTLAPTATTASALGTLTQDATCRLGPSENYFKLYAYFVSDTFLLKGRNKDGDWVLVSEDLSTINSPGCWLPVAALQTSSDLAGLSLAEYELLPPAPSAITATHGVCGNNKPMVVEWSPVVDGVEYKLYRNWKAVSTQTGGKYYDVNLPEKGKAVALTYMVQGINAYGTSPSVAVGVTYCGK